MSQFFGKYRGTVKSNLDPLKQGRVQVSCPAVLGEGSMSWALPSAPYAGAGVGFFAVPPVGANVWVEFEGGDTRVPIWSGCFWGPNESPNASGLPLTKMLKTDGVTLTIDDLPMGTGCTLEVKPPIVPQAMKLVFDKNGIEISLGAQSIKLSLISVSINNGALEVK